MPMDLQKLSSLAKSLLQYFNSAFTGIMGITASNLVYIILGWFLPLFLIFIQRDSKYQWGQPFKIKTDSQGVKSLMGLTGGMGTEKPPPASGLRGAPESPVLSAPEEGAVFPWGWLLAAVPEAGKLGNCKPTEPFTCSPRSGQVWMPLQFFLDRELPGSVRVNKMCWSIILETSFGQIQCFVASMAGSLKVVSAVQPKLK